MWVVELLLVGLDIVVEVFSSKKEKKLEKRRKTGKRYSGKQIKGD